MSSREFAIAEEMTLPREGHVIRNELQELLDVHCITDTRMKAIVELLDELENSAWAAGMSEGYDAGLFDGSCALSGALA